jgi:hypothetical protein
MWNDKQGWTWSNCHCHIFRRYSCYICRNASTFKTLYYRHRIDEDTNSVIDTVQLRNEHYFHSNAQMENAWSIIRPRSLCTFTLLCYVQGNFNLTLYVYCVCIYWYKNTVWLPFLCEKIHEMNVCREDSVHRYVNTFYPQAAERI